MARKITTLTEAAQYVLDTKRAWERCWETGATQAKEDAAYEKHIAAINIYGDMKKHAVQSMRPEDVITDPDVLDAHFRS